MNDKDLQRAKCDIPITDSQGVITPEQRKLEQWRRDNVFARVTNITENPHRFMNNGAMINALVTSICTFIYQECQSAVKNYVWEQDQKKVTIGDAPCAETTDQRHRAKGGDHTDPASRYALYANVLITNGVTSLSPELLRSIDAIVSLTSHWSK